MIIQMKATEQYIPEVLFVMLYKVVLIFESAGEFLKCDHSNRSYLAVLPFEAVFFSILCKMQVGIFSCFSLC